MKTFQMNSEIISNKRIKKNYFELILEAPQIAQRALPGQFVNIKVSAEIEPLLRRPLSIHKIGHALCVMPALPVGRRPALKNHNAIILLYEIVGRGTELLSKRKSGEFLDVIGPLGNGFVLDAQPITQNAQRILIAGGMGTAPLVFLAERLNKRETRDEGRKTIVLIGAKTKDSILCEKEFKELSCAVKIATDDGSRGFKGYVSELLAIELSALSFQPSAIYACGPKLLLKEISRISQEYHIPAQLSLESHMACGIGACMGCVIKTRDEGRGTRDAFEYKRVCKEGPVFTAQEIIWDI